MTRTEPEEVEVAKRRAAIGATVRRSLMVAESEATAQSKRQRAYGRIDSCLTEAELMNQYRPEKPMDPDNTRKWMDGPGAGEGVDYDLVRAWAWEADFDLGYEDYVDPHALRTLCRELLRVNEALRRVLHGEARQ